MKCCDLNPPWVYIGTVQQIFMTITIDVLYNGHNTPFLIVIIKTVGVFLACDWCGGRGAGHSYEIIGIKWAHYEENNSHKDVRGFLHFITIFVMSVYLVEIPKDLKKLWEISVLVITKTVEADIGVNKSKCDWIQRWYEINTKTAGADEVEQREKKQTKPGTLRRHRRDEGHPEHLVKRSGTQQRETSITNS